MDILSRLKNKNMKPALLIIDAVPYVFPLAWVEETYTLGASVQYATNKDDPLIVLPTERSFSLIINIPMDVGWQKIYYGVCKQVIRATTLLFATTKVYRKEEEIKASQKISIFDATSFRYPLKPGAESFAPTGAELESKEIKEEKKKIAMEKLQKKLDAKKHGSEKKTLPFTNIQLPSWVPVACGYIGGSIYSLGCILTSFQTKYSPGTTIETWEMNLVEYEWKTYQEEDQTPPEPVEEEEKVEDIVVGPERSSRSVFSEKREIAAGRKKFEAVGKAKVRENLKFFEENKDRLEKMDEVVPDV